MNKDEIRTELQALLAEALGAGEILSLSGNRPQAALKGQPWLDVKYGRSGPDNWTGVVPAKVKFRKYQSGAEEELRLIVKISPAKGIAETLIPWIIETKGIQLERPYAEYTASAEATHTGEREAHAYRLAGSEPALSSVMPRFYGAVSDPESGETGVVLEYVDPIRGLDASGALARWPAADLAGALRAAAGFHAAFWNREDALGWCGFRPTTEQMVADSSLWAGLLADSRKRFPDAVSEAACRRRERLIETLDRWHPVKDAIPSTLAHDDFNQRNVGFRGSTSTALVLGWGLARRDIPHRDVVELLTFLVAPATTRGDVDRYLDIHRQAMNEAGIDMNKTEYAEGFRAELFVESIDRVAMQAIFCAAFDLPYLKRINAAIEHLIDLYW